MHLAGAALTANVLTQPTPVLLRSGNTNIIIGLLLLIAGVCLANVFGTPYALLAVSIGCLAALAVSGFTELFAIFTISAVWALSFFAATFAFEDQQVATILAMAIFWAAMGGLIAGNAAARSSPEGRSTRGELIARLLKPGYKHRTNNADT